MGNIPRIALEWLQDRFKSNRIIIIIGSRQVGKTTIMQMYRDRMPDEYKQFYFDLELASDLDACQSIETISAFLKKNNADIIKDKVFLIIDEFHYIKNATKLFKLIYDAYPEVKILASGSSSIEIQKHLKESLAGRKKVYNLYTLSFEEFLRFKDENQYAQYRNIDLKDGISSLLGSYNIYLNEYLLYGGYPKVTLETNKEKLLEELQDIYDSYIQKDIKALLAGEEISSYNNLVKILASQIGNLLNLHELTNTLNISYHIATKYLDLLQGTFVIKLVPPLFSNKRAEISKMHKLYFMDAGIVNYAVSNFSPMEYRSNLGAYIENIAFMEIVKYKPIQYQIYFWRTNQGTEIDFVLQGNGELIPVEVKWQGNNRPIVPKNFISFFSAYKDVKRGVVVTRDLFSQIEYDGKIIYFIPLVLLNKFIKNYLG